MISDKYKIRLSSLAHDILLYDCRQFGFLNKQKNTNLNGLLNKVIPNLMEERKSKKSQFIEELSNYNLKLSDSLIDSIISSINSIWFNDDELNELDVNIWLRPQFRNSQYFSNLEENESKNYGMGISEYIRNLINEYVRLPEYARYSIAFKSELICVNESINDNKILEFDYENEHVRLNTVTEIYGFNTRHNHYIFGIDRKSGSVEIYEISKIKNVFISDKKFRLREDDILKFEQKYNEFKNNKEKK